MPILQLHEFQAGELKPLSIRVNSGLVCLSGASGSGKSLLLRSIADLIQHGGEAFLDKQKCSKVNPVIWRNWVGFLPSESAWWMDKVGEHFDAKKKSYLSLLNLPEDSLSWDISRCSTGEKQRLAIARLLAQQPKVLLLDEPTASLDPVNVSIVESLIKNYSKEFDTPVIWVSHDQQQIKRLTNRELKIENNEVTEVVT